MDMTSRQRLLAFALTVLALAALGTFLFVSGTAKHPAAAPSPHPTTAPASPLPPPPATPVQPTGSAATSSQVNIYDWLPFTQPQLAQAATVVKDFSAYYGTYSYSESAASYVSRLQGLATSQLAQIIGSGYAAPGVASERNQQHQVSAGSAVIDSLRAFGSSSITFVVTVNQKVTTSNGDSQQSHQYAVTASTASNGWQVSDIELASSGNQ